MLQGSPRAQHTSNDAPVIFTYVNTGIVRIICAKDTKLHTKAISKIPTTQAIGRIEGFADEVGFTSQPLDKTQFLRQWV